MKKNKKLLVLISLLFSLHAHSDEINLVSDIWCPYVCEPNSKTPGFMVEIANVIFAEAGHKVHFKLINWARAISETRDGKYTGLVGSSRSDAPDFIMPGEATGQSSNFFWINKDDTWAYKGIDSLKGKKMGVINSYSYGDEIDQPVQDKNPHFIIVSGDDALAKMTRMTLAKRLDGFVENPNVLAYFLKDSSDYKDKFKSVGHNVTKDSELFVAFSPKNPKSKIYAELMSKGIINLRKTGKLKHILKKYNIKDWK